MELFRLYFDENCNLVISIHWIIYVILFFLFLFLLFQVLKNKAYQFKNVEIDSAEIGIQGQKITIKPNHTNIEIAYKIWVELNTRKIGLPIDFEHDVIIEIYKSWYQFFSITRELVKELPATKIRHDKDTRLLIETSTKILNEGLRPHLTQWHAKFERWYGIALDKEKEKTPQQIQQKYSNYDILKNDMEKVNQNLIKYKESIYKLAFG